MEFSCIFDCNVPVCWRFDLQLEQHNRQTHTTGNSNSCGKIHRDNVDLERSVCVHGVVGSNPAWGINDRE